MNNNTKNSSIVSNIIYAVFSQFISLGTSILTSFILPKFLGVEDYGYYQLFIFYTTYIGFALFGLNDGIYLRFGGKKWEDLDKELIKIQFIYSIIIQICIIIFFFIFFYFDKPSSNRYFIYINVFLYMLISNTYGYFGYLFQTVNNTKLYSKSIIIERIFFILFLIATLLSKVQYFNIYILITISSKFISMIFCLFHSKDILKAKTNRWKQGLKELIVNMKIGINLMLANIASMLILGISRVLIDAEWGIEAFGKFSFSLSLTNFFLLFINQISMVLFPALKRITIDNQKSVFILINKSLTIILPIIYLAYLPVSILVDLWLPQYSESIKYLSIILPMCIFDGKMNLLYATYFKIFRMEKNLLNINIITVIVSSFLSCIGIYMFNNIFIVIIGIVIAIALRSFLSCYLLSRYIYKNIISSTFIDIIFAILFIFSNYFFNVYVSFFIIIISYLLLIWFNKSFVFNNLNLIIKKVNKT